jgi:hypothetical protein
MLIVALGYEVAMVTALLPMAMLELMVGRVSRRFFNNYKD